MQQKENPATIRKATPKDQEAIWDIIRDTIAAGDTYAFAPNTPKADMLAYWCGKNKHTYVACRGDTVCGTYVMGANQPGLGAHVANAGYMVSKAFRGKGVGRAMAEYSIEEAKRLGYRAMQFNFVVKNNPAVALWQRLGFKIVGEVPEAFRHATKGLCNVYIMWRNL